MKRTKYKMGGISPREFHDYINHNKKMVAICKDVDFNGKETFVLTFSQALTENEEAELDVIVSTYYVGILRNDPKIFRFLKEEVQESHAMHDTDYTIHCSPNLHPKRTFVRGELQRVDWYGDENLLDLILFAEMEYTRDAYGFAVNRTTTRTWLLEDGTNSPNTKITTKKYTINMVDQITEGKKRRTNIVNGIQLPVMGLMIQAMTVPPYSLSPGVILLTGRDFLDRHEIGFNNFKQNSSSITDFSDPNFGRKSIIVELEEAAEGLDPWLHETPASLGGASILQYLSNEFNI